MASDILFSNTHRKCFPFHPFIDPEARNSGRQGCNPRILSLADRISPDRGHVLDQGLVVSGYHEEFHKI